MKPFGIETEDFNDISVVRIYGRMQLADTELVESVARTQLARGRRKIIVDLAELDCLHSAGIGVLLELSGVVKERGGRVFIVGINPAIRETLRTLGVERVLDVRIAKEDAIAELG